jgi:hypothetical protein
MTDIPRLIEFAFPLKQASKIGGRVVSQRETDERQKTRSLSNSASADGSG